MAYSDSLKAKLHRKYNYKKNSKQYVFTGGKRSYSLQYFNTVCPVLYPNIQNKRVYKIPYLTHGDANKPDVNKIPSPTKGNCFRNIKSSRTSAILERIERNERSTVKDTHPAKIKHSFRKRKVKEEESFYDNIYMLPDTENKKDAREKEPKKERTTYGQNGNIKSLASDLYTWMESLSQNEPCVTVVSLTSLLLSSFEIKPTLAINLKILCAKELLSGQQRKSTPLEKLTYGNEKPSYLTLLENTAYRHKFKT
ncbi:hypothetical protein Ahia01_000025200 [Argonauta hians]